MSTTDSSTTQMPPPQPERADEKGLHQLIREPGGAERDPTTHARRWRTAEIVLGIGFPIALLCLWELASRNEWISSFDFPAPTTILGEIGATFQDNVKGNWWVDVRASLERMIAGYLIGVVLATAAGVIMGMTRSLRALLEPTLNALYTVPKLALIGVFLIIFGIDNTPIIALIAVTVFFFVWIQTMSAVMSVPDQYREAAASFGATRWRMFRDVILPASMPQILVGYRVAAGVAVLSLIAVELVFSPGNAGIGYRINNARQVLDNKQAYVGLVVAAVLGVLFTFVIKLVGRIVTPWDRDSSK